MGFIKDQFFGGAEQDAADAQAQGMEQGIGRIDETGAQIRADLDPTIALGGQARDLYGDFLGLGGVEAEQTAINNFMESPGQKFLRERGERTVLRNQAALGGLRGGNVMKELTEFGIGTAAGQLGERKNRLAGVASAGDQANLYRSGIMQGDAANVANLRSGQGQARASGILGKKNAINNTLGRVAGAFTGTGGLGSAGPGADGLPTTVGGAGAVNPYGTSYGVPKWFRRGSGG